MDYPQALIGWLTDQLEGVAYHYTPLEILETERLYPGLWENLNVESWQRGLMREELKAK